MRGTSLHAYDVISDASIYIEPGVVWPVVGERDPQARPVSCARDEALLPVRPHLARMERPRVSFKYLTIGVTPGWLQTILMEPEYRCPARFWVRATRRILTFRTALEVLYQPFAESPWSLHSKGEAALSIRNRLISIPPIRAGPWPLSRPSVDMAGPRRGGDMWW